MQLDDQVVRVKYAPDVRQIQLHVMHSYHKLVFAADSI